MTDTTDIAALKRPTRKNYDWSKAVWTDCDHCGEAHTGTVLVDDGARICAGCCDAEYYSAWEDLAERAIKLLEAERQRADSLDSSETQLIEERDSAEAALSDMYEAATGNRPEWSNMFQFADAVEEVEAEIAALKAKLANPVVLPAGYSSRAGHPFHEGERNVMIPNKHGDWLSRFEVEHAIHVAGFPFTVKGE